jgi:hypothetical protein
MQALISVYTSLLEHTTSSADTTAAALYCEHSISAAPFQMTHIVTVEQTFLPCPLTFNGAVAM